MSLEKTPIVSVLMPCYNAGQFLTQAIESILNQTLTGFELIIIDDGSSDDSIEKINLYRPFDERIVYLRNKSNLGIVASLNRGIQQAKGRFIARMDADDISAPQRLEKQVDYMTKNPDCIVCGTDISLINATGETVGLRSYFTGNDTIKQRILQKNPFAHPSTMIRKSVLIENNISYSEEFGRAEDYHLWMRLINLGNFANIDEFLFEYRISDTSIKSRYPKETLHDTLRLKKRYFSHANIPAILILLCESLLCVFPKRFILQLFLSLQKVSLLRLGKRFQKKHGSPEQRSNLLNNATETLYN